MKNSIKARAIYMNIYIKIYHKYIIYHKNKYIKIYQIYHIIIYMILLINYRFFSKFYNSSNSNMAFYIILFIFIILKI